MLDDPMWAYGILALVLGLAGAVWAVHIRRLGVQRQQASDCSRIEQHLREAVLVRATEQFAHGLGPMQGEATYEAVRQSDAVRGVIDVALATDGRNLEPLALENTMDVLASRVATLARKTLESRATELPSDLLLSIFQVVGHAQADVHALGQLMQSTGRAYGHTMGALLPAGLVAAVGLVHCIWTLPHLACHVHVAVLVGLLMLATAFAWSAMACEHKFSRLAARYPASHMEGERERP